jgi:hypothetical protein
MKGPFLRVLAVLTVPCLLAGCGGADTELEGLVPVTGTVTLKGSPLGGASVCFVPTGTSEARAASAITDDTGHFELMTLNPGDGAAPGDYQVTVTKVEVTGEKLSQEEAQKYLMDRGTPPPSTTKQIVQPKFSSGATSGLTATVSESGPNEFTFDVE